MEMKTIKLWKKEEFTYPVVGEFVPTLTAYLHEDGGTRPGFVVVPGGGYRLVSPAEGEIVAKKFYEKGFQTFVLTYTTCMPGPQPLGFQPLRDLSKSLVWIRKNEKELQMDGKSLTICGFSAGGHLCGSLAVHYADERVKIGGEYAGISNRPDYVVLAYPVITSGKYAHRDSFTALLGADASKEELEYMSLEKQVTGDMPPVFLWQTAEDGAVPVENSYLFAEACRKAEVPFEHHVFRRGIHGLSLADKQWVSRKVGGDYTMEQQAAYVSYCIEHGIALPEPLEKLNSLPRGSDILTALKECGQHAQRKEELSVQIWPDLVENWLKDLKE